MFVSIPQISQTYGNGANRSPLTGLNKDLQLLQLAIWRPSCRRLKEVSLSRGRLLLRGIANGQCGAF
jgi:hypothetical protein